TGGTVQVGPPVPRASETTAPPLARGTALLPFGAFTVASHHASATSSCTGCRSASAGASCAPTGPASPAIGGGFLSPPGGLCPLLRPVHPDGSRVQRGWSC